jgi:hypothetical protein
MKETTMKQVFIEFVIPDICYKDYQKILEDFALSLDDLHGLTRDSFQVREFEMDEIPF